MSTSTITRRATEPVTKPTSAPTMGVMGTLIGETLQDDAPSIGLAKAVEVLVRLEDYSEEDAIAVIDEAIDEGILCLNDAFEVSIEST
jgi:hypothetical protein